MSRPGDGLERRDRIIAGLLWYGTWIASAVIAAGMIVSILQQLGGSAASGPSGYAIVKAGVAIFILLPIARVALMLAIFMRERDYAYMAISALVLAIIGIGILAGL